MLERWLRHCDGSRRMIEFLEQKGVCKIELLLPIRDLNFLSPDIIS